MKTRRQTVLLASALLATVLHTPNVEAQVDQVALAQELLRDNVQGWSRAVEVAAGHIEAGDAEKIGPELRAALITLLERKHRIIEETRRRGEFLANVDDPEFIARVAYVVAGLRDPRSISALSKADYAPRPVIQALAAFGERAAPALLAVVTSTESHHNEVDHCLLALRVIVEGSGARPLSAETLDEIRRAAQQRLTERQQSFTTVWRAIDLAMVLDDPDLKRIVEALALDRNEVVARGVEAPDLIERTQKHAAQRLAGVPALPRP